MKTILYLGTDPERFIQERKQQEDFHLIHYPILCIVPKAVESCAVKRVYGQLDCFTHILFTSKNSVRIFHEYLLFFNKRIDKQLLIAIGSSTARALQACLRAPDWIATQETQEGVVELLEQHSLEDAYFLLPRSALSRPIISTFFDSRGIAYFAFDLYNTYARKVNNPLVDLKDIDEIFFTSPSTVYAFLEIFGSLPKDKIVRTIGPITQSVVEHCLRAHLMQNG